MSPCNTGTLLLFILVVLGNLLALLVDLVLALSEWTTITEYVWEHPILGVPLVAWQVVGALALFLHFYDAR